MQIILTRCGEIVGLGWYFSECREILLIYFSNTPSLQQRLQKLCLYEVAMSSVIYRKFSNKGAGRAGKPLGGALIR